MAEQSRGGVANWPRGLLGLLVCAIVSVLVALTLYLTIGTNAEWVAKYGADGRWWLEERREGAIYHGQLMLIASCIYWGIAALFGNGRIERLLVPNILLAAALVAWLATLTVHFYGWTDTFCDQLPFSHERFDITRILECPSNAIFFGWLMTLAPILCLASLILRIVQSRRRDAAA